MVPLIRTVRQNVLQHLLDLLERARSPARARCSIAPHAPALPELKQPDPFRPPGFMPLAFAGLLLIAAAGVHERIREHGHGTPRQRTHLRITRIAYASPNPIAPPQGDR